MPCSLIYTLATQAIYVVDSYLWGWGSYAFWEAVREVLEVLQVIMEAFRYIYFMDVLWAGVKCAKQYVVDYRHTDENVNCLCHITYDQTVIAVCIRLTGGIVRLSCEALAGGSISCKNCPTVRARKRYTFHCIQGEFWTVFEINSLYCPLRRLTRKPGCPQSVGYRPL